MARFLSFLASTTCSVYFACSGYIISTSDMVDLCHVDKWYMFSSRRTHEKSLMHDEAKLTGFCVRVCVSLVLGMLNPSWLLCLPTSPLQFRLCDLLCCRVPISCFVASLFCSSSL
ncbi:hypothetical protein ZWY2020_039633 [Hordeum vulgare]|nr:hypothetical protein ZWY2020_039633 [Hordeum vulgare]